MKTRRLPKYHFIIQHLAARIGKAEGKKHQASIGDIREILSILKSILAEDHFVSHEFMKYIFRGGKK